MVDRLSRLTVTSGVRGLLLAGVLALVACGGSGPPDDAIEKEIRKVLGAGRERARTGEFAMWIQGNRCLDPDFITRIAITNRRTYGAKSDHVDVSFGVHTSAPLGEANCAPGARSWTGRIDFKDENGVWKPTPTGVHLEREAKEGEAPLE